MEKQPFPHDATPDVHSFSSPPENVRELINMYGTYNIQRTADTGNFFPAIAQGLPKDTHFKIGRTELDKLSKE